MDHNRGNPRDSSPTIVPLSPDHELHVELSSTGFIHIRIFYRKVDGMRPDPKALRFKREKAAEVAAAILARAERGVP